MSAIVRFYQKLMKDHLLIVQSLQTATLLGTGDVIAQTVVERKSIKELNFVRTGQFFAVGAVFVGPTLGIWFKYLDKTFQKTQKLWIIKKVAVDQICFIPIFHASAITILNFLEGHDWPYVKKELTLKYPDVLLTSYKLWPAVQLFNFYLMPLRHQVLLVQSVALFWNIYLSWKLHLGKET